MKEKQLGSAEALPAHIFASVTSGGFTVSGQDSTAYHRGAWVEAEEEWLLGLRDWPDVEEEGEEWLLLTCSV
jgi:hypothetical protein